MQAVVPVTSSVVARHPDGTLALVHDGAAPAVVRERIDQLTRELLAAPEEVKLTLHVEHAFCDGMYIRRLFIPKDTLVAGRIHKKPCINIVERGRIEVLTEFGCRVLEAGWTGVSEPGVQKVGHALEDSIFVNVFRTDKTNPADIEAELGSEHHPLELEP